MEISSTPSTNTKPLEIIGRRPRRKRSGDLPPATNSSGSGNKRSSFYRGVTRHKLTGRYEAHLWDKNYLNKSKNKKGKQVYLGAYDSEETAARNYDLAALKYWGTDTILNFPVVSYDKEYEEMQGMSKENYLASLRRRSSGFSRGASKYRGVARHHYNGRWEARIGRINGNKYLYLGTFSSEEEAAQAYDRAALVYRGPRAVTNFDINQYKEIQSQAPQSLPLLQSPHCQPQPLQHNDLAHVPVMHSDQTYSFDGTLMAVDDLGELSWSLGLDSNYDTFFISDLVFDNEPDNFGGLLNDIGGFVNDIERLFDESKVDYFGVNGEEIEKSIPADYSGSPEMISPSLIGGQHLVEEEMMSY